MGSHVALEKLVSMFETMLEEVAKLKMKKQNSLIVYPQ